MSAINQYYKEQLAKVNPTLTIYSPTIKIFANGNGKDTHHIDLNPESAQALVEWLQANFLKGKSASQAEQDIEQYNNG